MRRFIMGAVAAAAALAFAGTPAYATHDQVCTPPEAGPPICVDGIQHTVSDKQAAAAEAFNGIYWPIVRAYQSSFEHTNSIPEPLCVPQTAVCVKGVREHVKSAIATPLNFSLALVRNIVCFEVLGATCPPPTA